MIEMYLSCPILAVLVFNLNIFNIVSSFLYGAIFTFSVSIAYSISIHSSLYCVVGWGGFLCCVAMCRVVLCCVV